MSIHTSLASLRNLLTLSDISTTDATVKLGWMTIATIAEDDGYWFVTLANGYGSVSCLGDPTLEAAFERLVKYLGD